MPKTKEQEKLEGNPGKRAINKNSPSPDRAIPDPPKFLSRVGKRAYHDLVRMVGNEGMRVMAKTDSLALSLVCDAYAEYRKTRDVVENLDDRYYISSEKVNVITHKDGSVTTEKSQIIKRHPAVGDAQDAWKRIMQGLGKFGMTPYDRKNVNALEEEEKETREDKMARRRADAALRAKERAKDGKHIKKVGNV